MTHQKSCTPTRERFTRGLELEVLEPRMTPATFAALEPPATAGAPPSGDFVPSQQPIGNNNTSLGNSGNNYGTFTPGPTLNYDGTTLNFGSTFNPEASTFARSAPAAALTFASGFTSFTGFNSRFGFFDAPRFLTAIPDPYNIPFRVPSVSSFEAYSLYFYRVPPSNLSFDFDRIDSPRVDRAGGDRIDRFERTDTQTRPSTDDRRGSEIAFVNVYRVGQADGKRTTERVDLFVVDARNPETAAATIRDLPKGEYRLTVDEGPGERVLWEGTLPIATAGDRATLLDALQTIRTRLELDANRPAPGDVEEPPTNEAPPVPPDAPPEAAQATPRPEGWSEQVERLATLLTWAELPAAAPTPSAN